ncbi:AAA family ATPase [Bradyrhizobium sp. 197]|nr:AAA family ATPase [Bradyrhizobium sp. 197]
MYLRSLAIDGVRSIESLRMDFEPGQEPGWHVIVGPNGSGKSSIVKAFALSMLDEADVKQFLSSTAVTSILDKMIRSFAKRDASGKPKTDPQPSGSSRPACSGLWCSSRSCLDMTSRGLKAKEPIRHRPIFQ